MVHRQDSHHMARTRGAIEAIPGSWYIETSSVYQTAV